MRKRMIVALILAAAAGPAAARPSDTDGYTDDPT